MFRILYVTDWRGCKKKIICLSVCYFSYSKVILKDKANETASTTDIPAVLKRCTYIFAVCVTLFPIVHFSNETTTVRGVAISLCEQKKKQKKHMSTRQSLSASPHVCSLPTELRPIKAIYFEGLRHLV